MRSKEEMLQELQGALLQVHGVRSVEVVDILRDKADLEFKRDSEAKVAIKQGELVIEKFYPMNLLQKLSLQKQAVDRVAADAGVADRVEFGGWCPDPGAIMLAADVVVHASIDEASPQAVYEAAGYGVPVVATWAGGIRDILGQYQRLVPPGDVEALAEAIIRVVDDLPAARREADSFAAEVRERYGVESCGSSYLEACRQARAGRERR